MKLDTPLDFPDSPLEHEEEPHPADEDAVDETDIPQGPYDQLPHREAMRKPGFVGARRDTSRTRLPYRRIMPYLRKLGK